MEIFPFDDDPNYSAQIDLDGKTYTLSFKWVEAYEESFWVMDIADELGADLETGIRLVYGETFGWRNRNEKMPKGKIALLSIDAEIKKSGPDYDDMVTGRTVLIYDDSI